jgi:transcriptional regulator with XRE-family HTH domain
MQESEVFTENEITSMYKNIGENVKKYRELKGMSQLQLSNAMGYSSVSLVSAAELCSDSKHFNLEHLYKIAKILDIEMSELIKR